MRITGGEFSGRRIVAPRGVATRPTTDKVRAAMFNILRHGGFAPPLQGARVLDLFAGSGALGLEAASHGARFILFVDESAAARAAIRANVEALGLGGMSRIWRRDVTRMGRCAPMRPFDLAFLDPPYGKGLGEKALAALASGGWLKPGALVVLEESARADLAPLSGFTPVDAREYGDTRVHFLRHERGGGAGQDSSSHF